VPRQASRVGPQSSAEASSPVDVRPARRPGAHRARHRAPRRRRGRLRLAVFAAVSVGVLSTSAVRSSPAVPARAAAAPVPVPHRASLRDAGIAPAPRGELLPGVGAQFGARIPADTRQALVVTGTNKHSDVSVATLWQRDDNGRWLPGAAWPAHNALRGWTTDHHEGDLHSPVGVFSLSAAGGLEADPGTKLPYDHSHAFDAVGTGFEGEPLTGAFDYVVAIDYNRVPGSSPLDPRAPLGSGKGQGIWVHVDHDGPTHGCVSLSRAHMVDLLKALNPADHPVIVMGDRTALGD
jgi:L,D-peptidoglycan transpeptidase YkuD (ErfK/YbiS/YcfS/YnhG family)